MKSEKNWKRNILLLLLIVIIGGTVIYASYAWLSWSSTTAQKTNISSNVASVLFEDGPAITVAGLSPVMNPSSGTVAKTFTIKSVKSSVISLNVSLKTTSIGASLASESFKCVLQKSTDNSTFVDASPTFNFSGQAANSTLTIAANHALTPGTYYYRLVFYIDGNVNNDPAMMGASYKGQLVVTTSDNTPASYNMLTKLGLTGSYKGERTDFTSVATTDEGIYSAVDDYGTSYYFRGAVTNNYVKFAGYYWRIIRINGDGTIRMIYDGTSVHANGESSDDRRLSSLSVFNSYVHDNAYEGFMYGSTGQSGDNAYANTHANSNSSTIKGALDTWYSGLSSTNKGYIVDRVFCGDRTVNSETNYTGDGSGTTTTSYGKYRLESNKSPQLICTNKNDKYTVSDTMVGNGALTNPIGLITADEVAMAGGVNGNNNKLYYLYIGPSYWTMSPSYFVGSNARVYYVGQYGNLSTVYYVTNTYGVRPVINLKSDITFTSGSGSQSSPWIVGTGNA